MGLGVRWTPESFVKEAVLVGRPPLFNFSGFAKRRSLSVRVRGKCVTGGCDLQQMFKTGLVRHIIGSEGYDDCALAEDMSGGLPWLVWYRDPMFCGRNCPLQPCHNKTLNATRSDPMMPCGI
jgi:hypothetical protein